MAIRAEELQIGVAEPAGTVDIDRDRLLVLRHQQGDVEAFDELYRRYHDRLVLYCERRVGDRHVAEELAQEAFLRALRAMPRFAGERRFYPWMTVIAQRLCIDHHRKTARVEPSAEIDGGFVEPDHDDLFAQVDRTYLGAAMQRLAPRHREILELREGRGWSYQQIAVHLDVPMTTVEALLHRARKALRREFLAVGGEDRNGLPVLPVLAGAGLLGRLRTWLRFGSVDRLAPALAAAGAAVGLVVGPLTHAPSRTQVVVEQPAAATASSVAPAPAAEAPAASGAPPAAAAVAVEGTAGAATTTAGPPPTVAPDVDGGVVTVYLTPEGAQQVQTETREMPVNGTIAGFDYGLDAQDIVDDAGDIVQTILGDRP